MKIEALRLAGTFEITFDPKRATRGTFTRWFDREIFARAGLPTEWVQANESASQRGALRGLHFQRPPHTEAKFVRVVAGAIFDVFVDLRRGSATYGQWDSVEISQAKVNAVLVTKRFAHRFYALSYCVVSYLVDNPFSPAAEGGLAWNDPRLAIASPAATAPIVSDKDPAWPRLAELEPLA